MIKYRNDLTAEYIRSILDYNPETGIFTWKKRTDASNEVNGKYAGKIAGTYMGSGISIVINKVPYVASNLAWLYMTGEWSKKEINHKDLDCQNICFNNLREATRSQSNATRHIQKNNTSGYKGVRWDKKRKYWYAIIKVQKKQIWCGCFDSPQKAHIAYCQAARKYFGEFARAA